MIEHDLTGFTSCRVPVRLSNLQSGCVTSCVAKCKSERSHDSSLVETKASRNLQDSHSLKVGCKCGSRSPSYGLPFKKNQHTPLRWPPLATVNDKGVQTSFRTVQVLNDFMGYIQ